MWKGFLRVSMRGCFAHSRYISILTCDSMLCICVCRVCSHCSLVVDFRYKWVYHHHHKNELIVRQVLRWRKRAVVRTMHADWADPASQEYAIDWPRLGGFKCVYNVLVSMYMYEAQARHTEKRETLAPITAIYTLKYMKAHCARLKTIIIIVWCYLAAAVAAGAQNDLNCS